VAIDDTGKSAQPIEFMALKHNRKSDVLPLVGKAAEFVTLGFNALEAQEVICEWAPAWGVAPQS
jgi:hypothetical protein